jgi:hypothetical protein
MENARQLQCKPLQGLEKIRRRKNNGKQWKNNEKTMRRASGTDGKSGRVLTSGWTPEDRATALRASRRQVGCDGSISS